MAGVKSLIGITKQLRKILFGSPETKKEILNHTRVVYPSRSMEGLSDDVITKALNVEHGIPLDQITPEMIAIAKHPDILFRAIPYTVKDEIIPSTAGIIGQAGKFDSAILAANARVKADAIKAAAKAKTDAVKAAMSPENIRTQLFGKPNVRNADGSIASLIPTKGIAGQGGNFDSAILAANIREKAGAIKNQTKETLLGAPPHRVVNGMKYTEPTAGFLGRGGELSGGAKALGGATGLAALAKVASGNEGDYVDPLKQPYMGVATQDATGQEVPTQDVPSEDTVDPTLWDRINNLPDAVKYGVPLGALAVGTGAVGLRRILNKNRG